MEKKSLGSSQRDEGYVFTGWSGDVSGTNLSITVTMNDNKNIVANFMLQSSQTKNFDINNDKNIDVLDLVELSKSYGKKQTDIGYDITKDFNDDGVIDIYDLVKLASQIN